MNGKKKYSHKTVMLYEAINSLNIQPDGTYIDATFGCGGHSRLILSKLGDKGRLIAIDRDPQAIKFAKSIGDLRFSAIHGPFSALRNYVSKRKLIGKINGILLDLGVSSLQLEDAERGFSFMRDGPLDMRMDPTQGKSAAEWLQTAEETDIAWVIKTFGEEHFSKQIARAIVKRNLKQPIKSTKELVKILTSIIPLKNRFKHPATRTFQAIRIWINNEHNEIKLALKGSVDALSPNGRLSIISFHSLEDRIVKNFIREQSIGQPIPHGLPINDEQLTKLNQPKLRALGKLKPNKEEIKENPHSRSSILRFAERVYL